MRKAAGKNGSTGRRSSSKRKIRFPRLRDGSPEDLDRFRRDVRLWRGHWRSRVFAACAVGTVVLVAVGRSAGWIPAAGWIALAAAALTSLDARISFAVGRHSRGYAYAAVAILLAAAAVVAGVIGFLTPTP